MAMVALVVVMVMVVVKVKADKNPLITPLTILPILKSLLRMMPQPHRFLTQISVHTTITMALIPIPTMMKNFMIVASA